MVEVVERPRSSTDRAKDIARRVIRHENAALVIVLASIIGAMALATGGKSILPRNMRMIPVQTASRGVASLGQAFVILSAGIDLSIAGVAFATSALGAAMMTHQIWQNILGYAAPIWVGIPAMLAAGAGLGAISGLLVSRANIPPLITTLGMWQIAHGIGFFITGGFTITRMVDPLRFFGQGWVLGGTPAKFPVGGIMFLVMAATVYFVLHHTSYARAVYATGGNPVSAWLAGINVRNIRLSVFIISGLLAATGGLILTSRVMSVSYQSFYGLELESIASVVIGGVSLFGGKGTLIGVVLGVFIIGVIKNGMSILGTDPFMEGLLLGALVITAVGIDYWRKR